MTTPPKKPPRFVPTLTDVVVLPEAAQLVAAKAGEAPPAQVLPAAVPLPDVENAAGAAARHLPDDIEEYVVHRLMQRVDLVLDQRLREAIALVVQEQTRSMVPRLREEVESVVRHAVYEAVAEELARDGRGH